MAPFAGTIVEVSELPGSVVNPGKALVKIATLDRIRVKLTVSEAIIGRFARGQKAFAIINGDTTQGTVEIVSLAADESSHTFTVECVFDNKEGRFRPGMYVTVDVVVREIEDALALPMEAVISEGAGKYVFTVEGGVARKVPVKAGIRGGNDYQISEGVPEGAKVVLSGASNLSDGAKVKVVAQ
jgi:RND family efflux transporter MFP subunit